MLNAKFLSRYPVSLSFVIWSVFFHWGSGTLLAHGPQSSGSTGCSRCVSSPLSAQITSTDAQVRSFVERFENIKKERFLAKQNPAKLDHVWQRLTTLEKQVEEESLAKDSQSDVAKKKDLERIKGSIAGLKKNLQQKADEMKTQFKQKVMLTHIQRAMRSQNGGESGGSKSTSSGGSGGSEAGNTSGSGGSFAKLFSRMPVPRRGESTPAGGSVDWKLAGQVRGANPNDR